MRGIQAVIAIAAFLGAITGGVACGGGSETATSGGPQLASSPIPTVTPAEPTVTVCGPATELTLPADFPTDQVVVPPDFVVWAVERSPHLRVIGTVNPPADANGRPPWTVVADALTNRLQAAGWKLALNQQIEGRDYDFTSADGRSGHFLAQPRIGCSGAVNLTYDINWITG